ncbi:DUF445 domain-containing protein [Azotosporobacter soli]|uniref:DUF445 domain-containing protein n=1 Tax=Azotosporobacter soli TaxID=3055040 RepID=UPI0031FEAE1A
MANRQLANGALAVAFGVFLLATWLGRKNPDLLFLEWLRWAAEAALVGGIADWFAVNALFRRPLGFPWHTALIPRHRQRVTEAVAQLVETELLNLKALRSRLAGIRLVEWLIGAVAEKGIVHWLRYLLTALAGMDSTRWGREIAVLWRSQVRVLPLEEWLRRAALWALEKERYRQGLAVAADALTKLMARPEMADEILQLLQRWKEAKENESFLNKMLLWLGEATDAVNLEAAAQTTHQSLLQFINDLQQPEHPLYDWVREQLQALAAEAGAKSEWQALIRDGLRSFLDGEAARHLAEYLLALLGRTDSALGNWLVRQGEENWQRFAASNEAKEWLEEILQAALQRLLESEHPMIGRLVRLVLNQFSDEELNRFIEDKAGEDLQWIRVNGVLVGALAGSLLFGCLHFIYRPLLAL